MRLTWLLVIGIASSAAAVDVRDFGAVGDGITDDTDAIRKAFAASSEVQFPKGVFVVTDGIVLPPSATISGSGSPTLGTFPLNDDKEYLTGEGHPGLPGTTILLRGSGKESLEIARSDQFSIVRYGLKTATDSAYYIDNLAIILDMQVMNDGKRTSAKSDNRSDFDVGLLVDDSPGGSLRDVSIFGYWKKAGLCVVSRGEGGNPDYNTFWNCSFSGDYGVALIGTNTETGPGLSGTQFYGCNLFSKDHHKRSEPNRGSGALFIDGNTSAVRAEINGHYFFGGCVRTYNNVAVRLDHASNVAFHGTIFEVPGWDGKNAEGADKTGQIVGTGNTKDVMLFGCRMHDIGLTQLGKDMADGSVTVTGGLGEGFTTQTGSGLARVHVAPNGDPILQLATETDSSSSGWTMRSDRSHDDRLAIRYDNVQAASIERDGRLTVDRLSGSQWQFHRAKTEAIQDGAIPASQSRMKVKSADEGTLIRLENGEEGDVVMLEQAEKTETFSVKNTDDGNIRVASALVFDSRYDRLTLTFTNGEWIEIARTDFPKDSEQPQIDQ